MKLRLAFVAVVFLFSSALVAQPEKPPQDPEKTQEPAAEKPELPAIELPDSVEKAVGMDLDDLELPDQPPAQLQPLLAAYMGLIKEQSGAIEAAAEAPKGSEARAKLQGLRTDRNSLIDHANAVAKALTKASSEDEALRKMLDDATAELQKLRDQEIEELAKVSTVPDDVSTAEELDLAVLKAQLRPLTKAQVEEELKAWLALLQKKSLQVRLIEVAGMKTEDGDKIAQRNEEAVAARSERDALISRVNAVIASFEEKSGDVTEAKAYVDSVVVAPEITGVRAAWATFSAWLISEDGGIALGMNVVLFLAILFAFKVLSGLVSRIIDRGLRTVGNASGLLRTFMVNVVRKLIMIIGIVIALSQLGVDIGPLLAAIGAAGFVIGFALQGTLSNFASGVMIMMYRPFEIGDAVSAGTVTGKVASMNLVSTTIKTFDNQAVIIPNSMIWGDVITNITAENTRRVDMMFGIGYSDDMGKAKEVMEKVISEHPSVLKDPEPIVQVHELADSSVNFAVRPWVKTDDYWDVYWDLTRGIKQAFDEAGISIPFPQQDVHFHGGGPALPAPAEETPKATQVLEPQTKTRAKTKSKGGGDAAPADAADAEASATD